MKKVVIIGGGISGLISSILLAKNGIPSLVIEKKSYPFHRVCGEYISNEAVSFLESMDLYPGQFNPPKITRFQMSSIKGRSQILPLDLGGFGISRFSFDHFLFLKARSLGVEFNLETSVENVDFLGQSFKVFLSTGDPVEAEIVIGAFGKRSGIDMKLQRPFIRKRSPYVGVKYHVSVNHPDDMIALHNFEGGYCGVSKVEYNVTNVCYLVHRDQIRANGSITNFEERVLRRNPFVNDLWGTGGFLFDKPEVINEISFERKSAVENHILMAGDSAGLITPLCGNGMAMGIHASYLVTECIRNYFEGRLSRAALEYNYAKAWAQTFSQRLFFGRNIQRLFGSEWGSSFAVSLALHFKPLAMQLIRRTHGKPFT